MLEKYKLVPEFPVAGRARRLLRPYNIYIYILFYVRDNFNFVIRDYFSRVPVYFEKTKVGT